MDILSVKEDDVQAHVNNALDAIGCLGVVVSLIIYSSQKTRINANDLPITFIKGP